PRPTKPRGSSPSGSSSWCCRTRERQDPPMTGTSPLREAWGLAIDLEDEYGTGPRATRRVQYASACTLSFGIPSCLRRVLESARVGAPSRATTALVPSGTEEAASTAASTIDPSAGR